MRRRDFLRAVALAGIAARGARGLAPSFATGRQSNSGGDPGKKEGDPMIYRTLGRTGERVSAIGMGGFHIGQTKLSDDDSIKLIRAAIDGGINFMDNSWDYNKGQSEIRMGKALKDGYRQKVFLMTKLDGRTKEEATKQINESLQRLQTDHLDLIQHHEIIRFDDPDRIFAENGAQEAVLEAKKAGKVRYIGFTGHKDPHIHLYMLEVAARHNFHFDTVQMPLNVMDAHFRSFEKQVLPVALSEGIAVLGMKSMGSGVLLKSGKITAAECLRYALSLPTSVVITGIDSMEILDQAFAAIESFHPLTNGEREALLAKTCQAAANGRFEPFKTSSIFDSTAENPEWLGEEPREIRELMPA
ncbi:MAG: aldo/keto reductase, partial [Acidobacteria bacterium]